MERMDYVGDGSGNAAAPGPVATPAGNNPSTWAGFLVLASLAVLLAARKSFARYM